MVKHYSAVEWLNLFAVEWLNIILRLSGSDILKSGAKIVIIIERARAREYVY